MNSDLMVPKAIEILCLLTDYYEMQKKWILVKKVWASEEYSLLLIFYLAISKLHVKYWQEKYNAENYRQYYNKHQKMLQHVQLWLEKILWVY